MKPCVRLLLLLLLCSVACFAQAAEHEAVDATVAHFMQAHKSVAVGVAIVANHQIAYVHSYGALRNDQPFDLASISKSLTAIVAVKFIEQGKLALDAPVTKYLPETRLPAGVTIKGLLSHTSGLPHYSEHFPDSGFTLANFTPEAMEQAPGHFIYSSPGYYLLSKVMEKVDHRPFLDQINQELAIPAGAGPLTLDPKHGWRLGSGGVMASPNAMAHIALALIEGKILDHAGFEMLWTPVATSDGYALGFYSDEGPPLKVSHNGSHPEDGIATRWVLYPGSGSGLVVLTHNEGEANPGDLTTAIFSAMK